MTNSSTKLRVVVALFQAVSPEKVVMDSPDLRQDSEAHGERYEAAHGGDNSL